MICLNDYVEFQVLDLMNYELSLFFQFSTTASSIVFKVLIMRLHFEGVAWEMKCLPILYELFTHSVWNI